MTESTAEERGYMLMSKSSIAICSLVRDCENGLKRNLPGVDKLRKCFAQSTVILVENDSKDSTKKLISDYSKTNSNVIIHSEDSDIQTLAQGSFSEYRIRSMASFRNKYLSKVQKLNVDYVLVLDMDVFSFSVDGIANSFGQEENWDCISSNGKGFVSEQLFPVFYDTYAFQEFGDDDVLTVKALKQNWTKFRRLKTGMQMLRVNSGFNALAIYKASSLKGQIYTCESNNGSTIKAVCEHVSLHRSMTASGHDKIFLNPSQLVQYHSPLFFFRNLKRWIEFKVLPRDLS